MTVKTGKFASISVNEYVWCSQIPGKTIEHGDWTRKMYSHLYKLRFDSSKRNFFKGLVECRNLFYIWTLSVFEKSLLGYQSTVWHLFCGWTLNRKGAMWKVINTNEHIQRQKMRGDGEETGKRNRRMIWNTQDKKKKWKRCKNFTRRQTEREDTKQEMAVKLTHYLLTQHASESQVSNVM